MKPVVCFSWGGANLLEQGPLNQPGGGQFSEQPEVSRQDGEDRAVLGCCGDPGRGLGAPSPEALPVCAQHCVRGRRAPHPQGGHLTPPGSGPSSSRCPPPTAGFALFPGRAAQHPAQQLVPVTLRRRRLRAPRPGVDIWAGPAQAPTGPLHPTFPLGPHGLHTYTQASAEGPAQPGGAQPIHRTVHILAAGWSLKSCTEGLVRQPPPSCGARAGTGKCYGAPSRWVGS